MSLIQLIGDKITTRDSRSGNDMKHIRGEYTRLTGNEKWVSTEYIQAIVLCARYYFLSGKEDC